MDITKISKVKLHSDEKISRNEVIFDDVYKALDDLKEGQAIRIKCDFPIYGWDAILNRYKHSRNIYGVHGMKYRFATRRLNTDATEHVIAKLKRNVTNKEKSE